MITQHVNAKTSELLKRFAKQTIVINSTADFRFIDAGAKTITLEDDTAYELGADISNDFNVILGKRCSIFSRLTTVLWEFTGTGDMFTGVDVERFNGSNFTYRAINADQIWNITSTVPGTSGFTLADVLGVGLTPGGLVCEKFGTFTDLNAILMRLIGSGLGLYNSGISISGSVVFMDLRDMPFQSASATFIGIDLGSAIILGGMTLFNTVFAGFAPGSIGISGLANSANFAPGTISSLERGGFFAAITPLSGVSASDIRFEVRNSGPLPDSTKSADVFLTSPETVVITTPGVFEQVAGANWSSDVAERFTATAAGVVTYISEISTKGQVSLSATVEKIGGGTDEIELAIAIGGTEVTKTISATKNKDPTTLTSIGIFTFNTGDEITMKVANIDTTANIIVSRASINVINGF